VIGGVPPPPPPPKPKAPVGPQRIDGQVAEANLIRRIQPVYPPLAKSARVQGTVEFTATISKEGNIENLQLVRGHPLLVNAAKEAVLQWKYRPTMLNGSPVEVITDIIVNFTLSQ
jgi:protein TonB